MDKELYRSKSSYFAKSKELLSAFIEYELGGKIETLKTFCLDELRWGSKFCNPEEEQIWSFDCDNTALVRALYVVLWGHIFEIKEGDIGSWSKESNRSHPYRGDTMNSFNSLFGEQPYLHRAKNHGLDQSVIRWKNVMSFTWQYHTIGNFILLPNGGNLNCERGRKGDYFDLLLLDIADYKKNQELYANRPDLYDGVHAIMEKDNSYLLETPFEKLKEIFYLDPYFDDNNMPLNLYGLTRSERGVRYLNAHEKLYIDLVDKYLETSEKIIEFRSQKMVDELKDIL